MPMKLGDKIRELRLSHPVYKSLRQFAETLQKSPSWISKVERNLEVPGRETLLKIAKLLDADSDELLQLAELIDPQVEETIVKRYSNVAGLLRTLGSLTPEQLQKLEQQAKKMQRDSLEMALLATLPVAHIHVPWMDDKEIKAAADILRYRFQQATNIKCPPVSPESIVFDYLDGEERLTLDIEASLGTNEFGHPIAGKMTVAEGIDQGGHIEIDQSVVKGPLYAFTLAHEIGHWILHKNAVIQAREQFSLFSEASCGTTTLQRDLQGSRSKLPPEEWQANRFAAHLLMPSELIKSEYMQRFIKPANFTELHEADLIFKNLYSEKRKYSRFLAGHQVYQGGEELPSLSILFGVSKEAMAIRLEELELVHDKKSSNERLHI